MSTCEGDISAIKSTQAQHTNQIRECIDEVALGADGSSLDFTTVGGQTSNISLPTSKPKIYTDNLASLLNVKQTDNSFTITNNSSFIFEVFYVRKGITIEHSSTIVNPFSLSDSVSATGTYSAKIGLTQLISLSGRIYISINVLGTNIGGPKITIKVTTGETKSPNFSQLTSNNIPIPSSERFMYRITTL